MIIGWGEVTGPNDDSHDRRRQAVPDFAAELGLTLLRYRLSQGLSLRGLARTLGMSGHGGLGEYEKGRRIPPADLLAAWERALRVQPGELSSLRGKALAQRAARRCHTSRTPAVTGAALSPPSARPAQLPPDVPDFTGRDKQLHWLHSVAARSGGMSGPVAVTWGEPGIGKTTLAIRFGHITAADYPDAQLYVNLRGASDPLDPSHVLSSLLRLLGVADSAVPSGAEERTALYRSLLADLRAFVLLDDAVAEAQVRPLLPGGPHCLTLVTSRAALSGLAGAYRVRLPVLDTGEARDLLDRIAGVGQAAEDRERLVRLCGYLPLAVRIAATRLANWPEWPTGFLADRLEDERSRLAELSCGDLEVRSAFLTSYRALGETGRWVFRCLGHIPAATFGVSIVAVLTDRPVHEAGVFLEHLVGMGLLQTSSEAGRYRLHDLLKIFSFEQSSREDDPQVRQAAVHRMARWVLATARAAADLLTPPNQAYGAADEPFPGDRDAALAWLDAEWPTVLGAARAAGEHGLAAEVFDCLYAMVWFFDLRCRWEPLGELAECAHRLACEAGLDEHQAGALNALSLAHWGMGRDAEAADAARQAIGPAQRAGDIVGEVIAWRRLGLALESTGQFSEASQAYRRALDISRSHGNTWDEGACLNGLGACLRALGRPGEAADCFHRALELLMSADDTRRAAMARNNLGFALTDLGSFTRAQHCHESAYTAFTEAVDEWGQSSALFGLGLALAGQGNDQAAVLQLEQAQETLRRIGERRLLRDVTDSLNALSERRASSPAGVARPEDTGKCAEGQQDSGRAAG
ncbi:MAG TPA: tetratricopeptide repeat protein [Streptosporangiaceae bacterium]|nr:tetratricopeptide repeat protein [Streptosporangiaceae bacterium]